MIRNLQKLLKLLYYIKKDKFVRNKRFHIGRIIWYCGSNFIQQTWACIHPRSYFNLFTMNLFPCLYELHYCSSHKIIKPFVLILYNLFDYLSYKFEADWLKRVMKFFLYCFIVLFLLWNSLSWWIFQLVITFVHMEQSESLLRPLF